MKVCINKLGLVLMSILVIMFLPYITYAEKTYLNDTGEYTINLASNKLFSLSSNLTSEENINHTFESRLDGSTAEYNVEYVAANNTGFLLKLRFHGFTGASTDKIEKISCNGESVDSDVCTGGCSGNEFTGTFHKFSVIFDASASNAKIFVNDVQRGTATLCSGINDVGEINFTGQVTQGTVKNNLVIANNQPPQIIGSLPNQTWPEDTSISFDISGNFTDVNNDALTYSLEAGADNISIDVNSTTGIVNLTPDPDFFGIRYVRFIANDSDNITFSNNVTLNVTNVNDLPNVSDVVLDNTDFLNRTNGSLIVGWTFSDADNDSIQSNETLWYINGIENESLRNLSLISSTNTTKWQNWTFSVRVFDGTGFSPFVNSTAITIDNALQFFDPPLNIASAELNQLFFYDVNYTDLDEDNITFYDNSSLFNITNEGIINFTPVSTGNMTVNITIAQNPNVSNSLIIEVQDTSAPIITAISTSNSGTTTVTVTLSVTTGETAFCRFEKSDLNYSAMTQMATTNSTSHSNSEDFTSDESGTYHVRCNDTYGNVMNFSNSTDYDADVEEPSSGDGGSGGGGGGGGGSGKYICKLDWDCTAWSSCENGKQSRDCKLVDVSPFRSLNRCPQHTIPEQDRICQGGKGIKATCSDNIQNQGEEGIDCGGPCKPCAGEVIGESGSSEPIIPTGAVTGAPFGEVLKKYVWAVILLIVVLILLSFYFRKRYLLSSSGLKPEEEETKKMFNFLDDEYK